MRLGAWRGAARGALLVAAVAGALAWVERDQLGALAVTLRAAPAAFAVAVLVHAAQLALTGFAWSALLPQAVRPGGWMMTRVRWVREAANNILPAGGLVGQSLAARALARRGVAADSAAATAAVDLTLEAATQAAFTLGGLGLLLARGGSGVAIAAAVTSIALAAGAVAALLLLQRGRLPLPPRAWLGTRAHAWLAHATARVAEVQAQARTLHADRRALGAASALHLAAWAAGAIEVIGVLHLLGWHTGVADGLIVESISQALRSAGFALPGAIGVQEVGLVGACALVGVPAQPALTLALIRRARELLVGVTGLAVYRGLSPHDPALAPARSGGDRSGGGREEG